MPQTENGFDTNEKGLTDKRRAQEEISPVLKQMLKGNEINRRGASVANPFHTINALK